MTKSDIWKLLLEEAKNGANSGDGGPFSAAVVRGGEIVSIAHNEVVKRNDPTAHAECLAIRKAGEVLGKFCLSDCELYSSCEPCPMCFSAIHWARLGKTFFVLTRKNAADIGFDDKLIYDILSGVTDVEFEKFEKVNDEFGMIEAFNDWQKNPKKIRY